MSAVEQPVLLPLPELMKQLDAKQEWLILPLADYQKLCASGRETPSPLAGAAAFIASAEVRARVIDGRGLELTAEFTAVNRSQGPALADLFATAPEFLGQVNIGGAPAVFAPGNPLRVLVPRAGRFAGTITWSVPLVGDIQRRAAALPLPLAGGLALRLSGDGKGAAAAPGLAQDGDGWRLVAPPGPLLPFAWLPGGGGDDAPAFGVTQMLDVQVQDGPRPVRWAIQLAPMRGTPPATLTVTLPPGFTCTASLTGIARLVPTRSGIEITRSAGALACAIEGFIAEQAPIALPSIAGAAWQTGRVRLAGGGALACEPPIGWRPLGANGEQTSRLFTVMAPDAGMIVTRLLPDAGIMTSTSTAIAVGAERATMEQVLLVRAGGTRLFRLPLRLPAGWKPTALTGGDWIIPPADELLPGAVVEIELPSGLAPGADVAILFTAEMATKDVAAAAPVVVDGAVRSAHRLFISAAPGIELGIQGRAWRLLSEGGALPLGTRAELRSDGAMTPVVIAATTRAAAVDLDAVCWLLPASDATWCRVDVRLAVREGELTQLELDLPLVKDGDLRLSGEGLTLSGDGPYTISAAKAWRGERLLRIEGRLRPEAAGKIPLITARFPGSVRAPVVRRWAVLQAPGERDLQLAIGPAAKPIDADELPAWSNAIPGAAVAAAWRLGDGDAGGWKTADRALAKLPDGFIDALELASQWGPEGIRTRASCRLAAAGLAELDLKLPAGAVLEQAAIDGVPAAVRRDGERTLLTLPSRTLVQIVLLYAAPLGAGRQAPPGLGGLPVTKTTWVNATDPSWRASALDDVTVMPLQSRASNAPQRRWLGIWSDPVSGPLVIGGRPPSSDPVIADDPRALSPPPAVVRPQCHPALLLNGQFHTGQRIGAPDAVAFAIVPLSDLRRGDVIGRALALIAGLILIVSSALVGRLLLVLAIAVVPLTMALLAWQQPVGALLGFCEWLPFAVVAGWVFKRMCYRRRQA